MYKLRQSRKQLVEPQLFVKLRRQACCMPDKHQDIVFGMLSSGIMHQALDTNAHIHVVQQFCCTALRRWAQVNHYYKYLSVNHYYKQCQQICLHKKHIEGVSSWFCVGMKLGFVVTMCLNHLCKAFLCLI